MERAGMGAGVNTLFVAMMFGMLYTIIMMEMALSFPSVWKQIERMQAQEGACVWHDFGGRLI